MDDSWKLHREIIRPEWVDYNGHMNVAYYVLVFDHATDAVLDHLDIGEDYRARSGCSVFVAEAHVTYERELHAGFALDVDSRIIGFDGKRLIIYHELNCAEAGGLAATNEVLCLHVDLATRRTVPFADEAIARLAAAAGAHGRAGRPARAGRAISLTVGRPR